MALFNILLNIIGGLQAIGSVQQSERGDRAEQQLPWRSRVKQVEQRGVAAQQLFQAEALADRPGVFQCVGTRRPDWPSSAFVL